jgi:hypothetical protein
MSDPKNRAAEAAKNQAALARKVTRGDLAHLRKALLDFFQDNRDDRDAALTLRNHLTSDSEKRLMIKTGLDKVLAYGSDEHIADLILFHANRRDYEDPEDGREWLKWLRKALFGEP